MFYNDNFMHINLNGLDKDARYKFEFDGKEVEYSGSYLMNVGLDFEIWWALQSRILVLKKVK